ncbi:MULTISPECIES: hypothetical protein [Anoxybacillus]|uniref:Uncharacterized protein n=2 Tax=Anoxybacillus TaxID=150247 RepID=A0A2G5RTQ6_9BACL|nr:MULTISPECIES: hypothetical protein [Anoxybacillus]MBA2877802.1 cbb3-type cytochrome oxidase subunit 3 [Anoxybacillus ayderensis]MCL6615934.1 hypothetical protein [Anoxybacillus ayderensis]NNU95276.1 hypothetical protein [Anoxybacillus sp. EFIL]OSX53439.1 hypothetical protein B7H16_11525 [Anoxybacillus ayderensis]PIC06165.1 hypothetical protein CS060_01195 [Anoxybacillus flavithermus]
MMDTFSWMLLLVASGVLVGGLVYTYQVGKRQKVQGEYDAPVSEKVAAHPYVRNPIFIAYIVFVALLLGYIAYVAIQT